MELIKEGENYYVQTGTPRPTNVCHDRSWVSLIGSNGKERVKKQWVCYPQSRSDHGVVRYHVQPGLEYLFGGFYSDNQSNYSYNKYGGDKGAFIIENDELTLIDPEPIYGRLEQLKRDKRQTEYQDRGPKRTTCRRWIMAPRSSWRGRWLCDIGF
jgi:hypothetical protein